jgi:hypothetical protein
MPQSDWNERLAYVNFNVNLVKDLSPVDFWNVRDELSAGLTTLAGDGNNYVGTAIANLDLGDFRLRADYYSNVGSLTATQINNNGCDHAYLQFTATGVKMHNEYNNGFGVKFTAPKAGKYTLVPVAVNGENAVYFENADTFSYFKVTKNGEALAIGPDGETSISANSPLKALEVDLEKGDVIEFAGVSNNNWDGYLTFNYNIKLMEETPVFVGGNLSLASDLSVLFAVMDTWFTEKGYSNPVVRFEVEGVVTEISDSYVAGGRRIFTLANLSPKQMNDTITATLIATNAEGKRFAYDTVTYSIAKYCYNQLAKADAKATLKTLCVDVLNYGAATQIFTEYKTDNLVNANLTPEQAAWATPERAYEDLVKAQSLVNNDGTIAPWKGGRLMLTGAITVEFSFETADIAGCYVEFNDGTKFYENDLSYSGGRYIVGYTGCLPKNMQEVVSAVVKNADGEVISGTISYSIESYCLSKWNEKDKTTGELTSLAKLCRAMIAYGDATAAFAG